MILVVLLACAPRAGGLAGEAPGRSPLPPFRPSSRATATYVGEATCAGCHPAAAAVWAQTGHARAQATLDAALAGHDPECLACHLTGLGHPGGGRPGQAELLNVQCEACHGPGSDHVRAPGAPYGSLPADASACVGCHTHENSPDFAFAPYWRRVAHRGG